MTSGSQGTGSTAVQQLLFTSHASSLADPLFCQRAINRTRITPCWLDLNPGSFSQLPNLANDLASFFILKNDLI